MSSQSPIAAFVRNPVMANLLAVSILTAGFAAAISLPRETFPETTADHILVTVAYPGASPLDVEQGVCVKIETALEGLPGILEVFSSASDNGGWIAAHYDPSITPTAEMLRLVQDRATNVSPWPSGAGKPIVSDAVIYRDWVVHVGVHGQASREVIQRTAEELRDSLLAHPGISDVSLAGARDYEVSIQVSKEMLTQFGLTLRQVADAISAGSLDAPAGMIRSHDEEINVRVTGQRTTASEFENLIVIAQPGGSSVRLGQIAVIRDAFEERPISARIDGELGAMVVVRKTSHEDISTVARIVRDHVGEVRRVLPDGIQLTILADRSRDVDERVDMLIQNGLMGIALLLGCLLLFMDFRAAVGVAMGLPVAMAGALGIMSLTGQTLNLISLFGLIMADAIVLDDSIIIADSVLARERKGLAPALAAIEGTRRVTRPVINASLTTLIMFVPMLLVEGAMGKLIYVLPVVVISSIVASLMEAFLVLPAHLSEWATWGRGGKESKKPSAVRRTLDRWIQSAITRGYRPLIGRLIDGRGVVLAGSAAAFMICIGLVWGGRTPLVLFPKLDCNTIRARLRLPEGTPAEVSDQEVARMEQAAWNLNDHPLLKPVAEGKLVRHVHSVVGEWEGAVPTRGGGFSEVLIELMPAEQRRIDVAEVMDQWREAIGAILHGGVLSMTREELGPTDKPIEIRLLGDDLDELRSAADDLEGKLATYAGVYGIEDDLIPGKRELQITLKPTAIPLGLTVGELAGQLRRGLFGAEAVRLQRGPDEIKVVVSHADADRRSLSGIESLRIRTPFGTDVPFAEVAATRLVRGFAAIGRQDGHRRVRVQADVDERHTNAEQIVSSLERELLHRLPQDYPGVTVRIDGQRKRISESLQSLTKYAVVCLLLTYVVLGAALRSYVQPIILMSAIPLGLAGAVLGHTLLGYDLSLMSIFGMTSVAGIVVNDALVLLDQVNENVAGGMKVREAVIDGSQSRVIAVFLTAITNVAGMAPLLAERSSQAVTLIPIAISVAFGLCFAMLLTLLIVPAMFMMVNDLRRVGRWLLRGGAFPTAESVEPCLAG